jgi:hypothetical protein
MQMQTQLTKPTALPASAPPSSASAPRPASYVPTTSSASEEVLVRMVETLRESSQLSLREVAVREREKALSERETTLLSSHARRSHVEMFSQRDAEDAQESLRDRQRELEGREARQRAEIEILKASLFQMQVCDNRATLHPSR